ncbi:MAG: hypothetical protein ACOCRX_04495 [Candidatus Woesearchaeota archaeon]
MQQEEFNPYENKKYSLQNKIFNILLIILFSYLVFLIIGFFSTEFINGNAQVVDIEQREEIAYRNLINEHIYDLQQNSYKSHNIYQLYIVNKSTGVTNAYNELSNCIVSNEVMLQELSSISIPFRYENFHKDYENVLRMRLASDAALLNYFKNFNPQNIDSYLMHNERYNNSFFQLNQMWNRLNHNEIRKESF